MLVIDKM